MDQEFEQFWAMYPRHRAKLDAAKAYMQARKRASADEILTGLEAYCRHMPREVQFRPYAASWLRAGGWMDEYPEQQRQPQQAEDWWVECKRLHNHECGGDRYRHMTRVQQEQWEAEQAATTRKRT